MLFNSSQFLIFFPIVVLIYYILPKKINKIWLLVASYYFYMCWNAKYVLLILTSTAVTFICGILVERTKTSKNKKMVVAGSLIINLGILGFFKYFNFTFSLVEYCLGQVGISISVPSFDILLPVGISFYTFQALGYTIDVYRGEIKAERNFLRYALFVSFFPQLVAGPIERSKNLLGQLSNEKKFDFEKARDGLFLMLWGYFLKIVLADRIAVFVDTVYGDYEIYSGCYLVLATVLFGFQIYCDFAGYSTIAMGAAKILGIELMENFDAPYLSTSVAIFWRRWHISLTSWFKDYLYIPLGGSRKGKIRKQINKLLVFMISGLWHGASISFVIWGGLNGLYQIFGELIMPLRDRMVKILRLNRKSYAHKLVQGIVTFVLVDFAWIFFRAKSTRQAIEIIKQMIYVKNPWILFDGSIYECGLDLKNYWVMIFGIMILIFADTMKRKGIMIRKIIAEQDYWFRYFVVVFSVLAIVVFGIWGSSYDTTNFIYFQF